jgi:hypothetical protein
MDYERDRRVVKSRKDAELAAANERKAAPAEESLPDPGMEGFETGALRI